MKQPKVMRVRKKCDMGLAPSGVWFGVLVILVTLELYVIFS